jgi:hypothetical protein
MVKPWFQSAAENRTTKVRYRSSLRQQESLTQSYWVLLPTRMIATLGMEFKACAETHGFQRQGF